MKALILAAGYATRLYPLTKEFPKPLLEVRARPIIDYIAEKIDAVKEIDEIIVVTNSKFIPYFKKWAKKIALRKRLSLVDDLTKTLDDRRGAIGDVYFAIKNKRIKDDLLVVGGDNLFDASLDDFIAFAGKRRKSPVIGAYNIKSLKEASLYGVIKLDKDGKIVDFQEKPKKPKSTTVAMCLYYFPKDKLKLIKEYLKTRTKKLDATGSYIQWLKAKAAVYGFVFPGRWYDIGDFKFYNEARQAFVNKKRRKV